MDIKKILILLVLSILIFISPSKISLLNEASIKGSSIHEIKSIGIKKDTKYTKYREKLITLDKNKILSVDEGGNEEIITNEGSEKCKLSSNNYIDILTEKKLISLDENMKYIFNQDVSRETKIFSSINNNRYLTYFKSENKKYIKLQQADKKIIRNIEYHSDITGVKALDKNFIVYGVNTEKELVSTVDLFDNDGALLETKKMNDIILEAFYINKYLYIVLSDEIHILNSNLEEIKKLKIKDISKISYDGINKLFLTSKSGELGYVEEEAYTRLKTLSDRIGVEGFNKEYLVYTKNEVYDKYNKKVYDSKDDIKDLLHLKDNSVAVICENYIKIIKVS